MAAVAAPGSLARAVARPAADRDRAVTWLAYAALSFWSVCVVFEAVGVKQPLPIAEALRYIVPFLCFLWVLLSRPHSPVLARVSLGWTLTVMGALVALEHVGASATLAVIPVAVVAGTAFALRWPLPTLLAAFLLAGAYNTLKAYAYIPAGRAMDLFLGAVWLALVYAWLTGRRKLPAGISLVLLPLGLYLVATGIALAVSPDLTRGIFAFRSSAWLMTLVFLVPLYANDETKRRRLHQGVLAVGFIVSAYAMLRWAIGAGAKEAAPAKAGTLYVSNDLGELRLIGGLQAPQELGVWGASMFAFALGSVLSPIGTGWRLVAAATAGMSGAAIFGADVRFGMVAAAAGGVAVVTLFAFARGFSGRRFMPLAIVLVLAAIGTGVFVTTKLDATGSSGTRFKNLVTDPINDFSVQQRLQKWKSLLADVENKPFGMGLGASGAAEQKYARYTSDASFDPDSSYIKIIYDQGFLVAVLFVAALIVLLAALALSALEASSPLVAGRSLASAGALVAFAVGISGGVYFEGLSAASAWLLIGIGATRFVVWRDAA